MPTSPSRSTTILISLGFVGFWLGFPNAVQHVPPLALLYPVALTLLGLTAKDKVDALRKGWFTGLAGASAALYWLALPVHTVGGLPWILAAPCALAIGAYVGVYGGVYALCAFALRGRHIWRQVVALGLVWYFLEILRGTLFTGFPWLSLATAFIPWPFMVQGASVVGSYALAGLFVMAALLLVLPLTHKEAQAKQDGKSFVRCIPVVTGAVAFLLLGLWGHAILIKHPPVPTGQEGEAALANTFPLIMVEGNIDQGQKWEPALQQATVDLYTSLSARALQNLDEAKRDGKRPLLIWPETSMPFYVERHPVLGSAIVKFVQEHKTPLVLGAPGMVRLGRGQTEIFNRAFLFDENGKIAGAYDKMHLVPFGEYLPPFLAFDFLVPLLQGVGDFTPGKLSAPLRSGDLALGMLICYESIFPEIAQKRVEDGANVLLNISNDGWFGDSAAPEQHLQLAVMRAIEQNRWLIRSTNTGISAIVDHRGRVILRGEQFRAQSLTTKARQITEKSIFHRLGPWLPYVAALLLLLTLVPFKRRRT